MFQPMVRIYDIPDHTFESDDDDDDDSSDEDESGSDGEVICFLRNFLYPHSLNHKC